MEEKNKMYYKICATLLAAIVVNGCEANTPSQYLSGEQVFKENLLFSNAETRALVEIFNEDNGKIYCVPNLSERELVEFRASLPARMLAGTFDLAFHRVHPQYMIEKPLQYGLRNGLTERYPCPNNQIDESWTRDQIDYVRREAEEQARQEAEQEARQQQEVQRRRQREAELAEIHRRREAAETGRREEEQRLAELADRREAEAQARREAEVVERLRLSGQQAAADARAATLREEYILTIQTLVRQNWTRPSTTQRGTACTVKVVQIPGGEIVAAEVVRPCNADSETQRSIISAINRVNKLPYVGYESVFQREIQFVFRY